MELSGFILAVSLAPLLVVQGIYVDKGYPYSIGKLNVSTATVTVKEDKSPLHTTLYFPGQADQYSVIFFIGGLNGYVWAEWYDMYLGMLASHGFFVVGVDYDFPAHDEQLSQNISKFFEEIDFLKTFLKGNPMLKGSTPYWNKTGLLCHSSGCDCTLRMIRENSQLFNSTIFLEPFSIHAEDPVEHTIPASMYGTELASIGHPVPCSIPGLDYNQFYKIWKCPRIVVEVAEFGHCDILDPFQWEGRLLSTFKDKYLQRYVILRGSYTVDFFWLCIFPLLRLSRREKV